MHCSNKRGRPGLRVFEYLWRHYTRIKTYTVIHVIMKCHLLAAEGESWQLPGNYHINENATHIILPSFLHPLR